jgi:uncharacterized protein YkwD
LTPTNNRQPSTNTDGQPINNNNNPLTPTNNRQPSPSPSPSTNKNSEPSSGPRLGTYQEKILKAHNDFRSNHDAPPLKWNVALEKEATEWAQNCFFDHTPNGNYGQNMAYGTMNEVPNDNTLGAVQSFYNEICNYDYSKTENQQSDGDVGHFTQLVSNHATELGCAMADDSVCPDGVEVPGMSEKQKWGPLQVCNYKSDGRWRGPKLNRPNKDMVLNLRSKDSPCKHPFTRSNP